MGQPIKTCEVFDYETRKWSPLPDLHLPRAASFPQGIVRDNKIIIVGGVTSQQMPLDRVDCFDIEKNKWVEFPSLPIGVVGPYVVLVNDKLYCIAGTDKKECNQSVVFDFDKREWLKLPKKPSPCYSCGGYIYDGKLYIIGGRNGKEPVQDVESFDFETQQWEKLSSMSTGRVFYSVVGIEDEIYTIGGLVPLVGIGKIVERYNIHEDMWCRTRDLNEIRSDSAYGIVGERIVVACGLGGKKLCPMDTGECIGYRGRRFLKIPQTSKPRASVTTINVDGTLIVANGVGDGGPQPMVEVLKTKKSKDKSV